VRSQVRWVQRWIVRAGLAGLVVVMCLLAGFSLLTQNRVARSAGRASRASKLSMLYVDARYRVGLQQSLMSQFRLSPDVSLLSVRGNEENQLIADLQRVSALDTGDQPAVNRLMSAYGAYGQVQYDMIQAVYDKDSRLYDRLEKTRGNPAFELVDGIVSRQAGTAQREAVAAAAALANQSASSRQAMLIAFGIGLGLIAFFGVIIARISARLNRARTAELERMAKMARSDPLTGLRNHRAFHDDLDVELRRASRGPTPLSLVLLDLDDLKTVNDTQGHQAGDERLQALASVLRTVHRAGDTAFRIGGDEFAVVLAGTRSWGAVEYVHRLTQRLGALAPGATVTAGVAEALEVRDKDKLIRESDLALITAKRINQHVSVYSQDMAEQVELPVVEDEHHTQTLANALALAVDAKDSYTRSHCQTVSQLCVVIANELGVDGERLARLRLAGLLHDVGKIGIPDSILQKPGPLSDEQYEQMKTHSVLGAGILEAADMPIEADWIRHHHERVDGAGYPDGLAGEEIPLESRIILVADAFEAMTSDRPYRLAPGQSYAIDELRRHAGTQFDAEIVEALVRCLTSTYPPGLITAESGAGA
jgi:diguanylate cyclase (GGDEF)-like protein/putative nucleotidyltransferase with HDIG domain